MRLSGFSSCAGGDVEALRAWGVGGIRGGSGGRGIRMLRVGGESDVGAMRGAGPSPGVVTGQWWWSPNTALGWWICRWLGAGDWTLFGTRSCQTPGSGGSSGGRSLTDGGFRLGWCRDCE